MFYVLIMSRRCGESEEGVVASVGVVRPSGRWLIVRQCLEGTGGGWGVGLVLMMSSFVHSYFVLQSSKAKFIMINAGFDRPKVHNQAVLITPTRALGVTPHRCTPPSHIRARARFATMSTAKVQPEGVQALNDPKRPSIHSQVSRVIASNSHLLAKAELYFTAFLSMSGMVSDIMMVVSLSSGAWGDGLLGELLCGDVERGMLPGF